MKCELSLVCGLMPEVNDTCVSQELTFITSLSLVGVAVNAIILLS